MNLSELKHNEGAKHYKKIVGRGTSSGNGKTAGRGHKGQNSRSGGGVRPAFEGGQTPLFKRLPKRGFTNISRKDYEIVNLEALNCACFDNVEVINKEVLFKAGLISDKNCLLKILGNGKLEKARTVQANKFSKSAEKGIVEAGGKIEVI